jgi:hypothetical protein
MDTLHDGLLYGNPMEHAAYCEPQTQNYDCVEMSAADVIEQITGQDVSEATITAEAQQLTSGYDIDPLTGQPDHLYDPNSGTDLRDAPALLETYGVQASYTDDSTAAGGGAATGISALEDELAAGHQVIASVDAETVWNSVSGTNSPDAGAADHAVVVTGIDTTNGVVYLNDSGTPNGAAEAVPLSVFEQAWATSGHAMVATDGQELATNPLDAPSPAFAVPADYSVADPFSTSSSNSFGDPSGDPFNTSFSDFSAIPPSHASDAFSFGHSGTDERVLAAAGGGIAAALAATVIHPRTRAQVVTRLRSLRRSADASERSTS